MNILFIYSLNSIQSTIKPLSRQEQMQFGISYISSLLKKNGHQTKLLVLSRVLKKKNETYLDKYIKDFQPSLICLTTVTTEYQFMAKIAAYIKSHYPGVFLIFGGPHVSLNPDEVIASECDALCVGEGEYPVLELVTQLEKEVPPSDIANLWIKQDSCIGKTPPRQFLQDIDSLPFPDREMWQDWIFEEAQVSHSVLAGRGCPFLCTYCSNHALKKLAPGTYVRFRSPENITREIKSLSERFPDMREIYLEVETFGVDKKWAMELAAELENLNRTLSNPIAYGANLRITPGAEFDELFTAFSGCNFRFINIGLESGSERVRKEILKRNYSNEDIIRAVESARNHGLQVALFNMIGLPNETLEDHMETVKMNRICLPDWHHTSIFFPYPGTDLYLLCQEQGLLDKPLDTDMERAKATMNLSGFSKRQIQRSYDWFDYYVYKGHIPSYKLLTRVLLLKLRENSIFTFLIRILSKLGVIKPLRTLVKRLF
ncbi:B12-binding domain-containing radical SAM protein [Chloroflexota bacterium]